MSGSLDQQVNDVVSLSEKRLLRYTQPTKSRRQVNSERQVLDGRLYHLAMGSPVLRMSDALPHV